ncbi:unnamed protein product [Knipowitschia caucasica]
MKMEKRPGMATFLFTTFVIFGTVLGQGIEGTGIKKDEKRNAILAALSKLSKNGWQSQKTPSDSTKNVHPVMRNIMGRLKNCFPTQKSLR